MKSAHKIIAAIGFGITLCVPITGYCQAATSPAETQPPDAASDPAIDTAQRLEGRLFFSEQERQRMNDARKRGLVIGDDGKLVEAPPSVLNGFVKRSDGKTAVWVDGDVRWNVQNKNAAALVPANVGGPAEYVKPSIIDTASRTPKRAVQVKKPTKARAKKITLPRLIP